ncbi:MAG: succinate dehydrogenase, cytochrome b556 subunit, partial [Chloroflexota bacterium]
MYQPRYRPALWPARYAVGAWAFSLHRIAGVTIATYGLAHIIVISFASWGGPFESIMRLFQSPPFLLAELLLMAAILFHALNGFRIILFDLGIGIERQKGLFWGLMALGVVLFAFFA